MDSTSSIYHPIMKCLAVVVRILRGQRLADVLPASSVWAFQTVFAVAVDVPLPVLVAVGALASGTLLWRRERPCAVVVVTMACHLVTIATGQITWVAPAAVCALYSAGRYGAPRRAWIAAVAADLAVTVTVAVHALAAGTRPSAGTLGAVAAVGLGRLMRLRRELSDRSRAEQAREAVRAERRRIAREMHDVVAHHISTMNLLVGAARTTMTRDPEQAQGTLLTAERTGREAMAEMRRLLHVLRADDPPDKHFAGYGAAALPDLIAGVRDAGLSVEMRVRGDPVELETATDHALYRIVQEALTNVRKHAGGARASVRIAYTSGKVEVTVRDDGPGAAVGGDGFGLAGMAERAAACGGCLRAAPRPEGGFEVHACLPSPAMPKEKA